jgi:hypothetical protein
MTQKWNFSLSSHILFTKMGLQQKSVFYICDLKILNINCLLYADGILQAWDQIFYAHWKDQSAPLALLGHVMQTSLITPLFA